MRLDRLLTLYFFHPLRKILGQKEGPRISILMYHSISDQDDPNRQPYFQTNTKPEIFAQHMQYLADNNYKVIPLSEAISILANQPVTSLPLATSHETLNTGTPSLATSHKSQATKAPRYAVLTFDDGHRDFYAVAWPILKKFGYPATMFLPTGFVDNERKRLNGKECLTWDEVEALASQGAMFGAHTVSHIQLYGMDSRKIDHEISQSKREIEEKLHGRVEHYAYALAFPEHDEEFVTFYEKSLREARYRGAMSTRIGTVEPGDNLYRLKRLPVNTHDDIKLFQAKLESGYDWLYKFQYIKKKMSFVG